jgi:A/G-specific adenine glycosylase
LAQAPFRQVAALWSGLGYNVRAKRLHEAAKLVHADGWPDSVAGLERLPGVGPYTAQAIAAFAFGTQVAAVDTNVRRVLSRWHGEVLNGRSLPVAAGAALGDADPVDWNQAMMDLGATVCRPRDAQCGSCPVSNWCAGPSAYQPPRAQARFEGSVRQVRGAIMRELIRSGLDFAELVTATGYSAYRLAGGLEGLLDDELIENVDGLYSVVD